MLTEEQDGWLKKTFGIDMKHAEVEGAKSGDELLHRKRGEDYEGEEKELGFRAGKLKEGATEEETENYRKLRARDYMATKMYTEEERKKNTASVDDGLLKKEGHNVTGKHTYSMDPKTREMVLGSENSTEIVDLQTGQVKETDVNLNEGIARARKSGGTEQVQTHHHSTLVQGGDVAGAGIIDVRQGKITEISNSSGHYKPKFEHLLQVVEGLLASGALLSQEVVDFEGKPVNNWHPAYEVLESIRPMVGGLKKDQARMFDIVDRLESGAVDETAAQGLEKELDKLGRKIFLVQDGVALLRKMGIGASNKISDAKVEFNYASETSTGLEFRSSTQKKTMSVSEFVMGEGSRPLEALPEEVEDEQAEVENDDYNKYLSRDSDEDEEDIVSDDDDDEVEGVEKYVLKGGEGSDEVQSDEEVNEDTLNKYLSKDGSQEGLTYVVEQKEGEAPPKVKNAPKPKTLTRDATGRNAMLDELKEVARQKGLRPEDREDMPEGTISTGQVEEVDRRAWKEDLKKIANGLRTMKQEEAYEEAMARREQQLREGGEQKEEDSSEDPLRNSDDGVTNYTLDENATYTYGQADANPEEDDD